MRVTIIHASAGHGHQKVAEAVCEGFLACGLKKEEVQVFDVLDSTPSWFKALYTSLYYYSVRYTPRAWGAAYDFFDNPALYNLLVHRFRQGWNNLVGKRLAEQMSREKPDAILSTHFLAPEVLGRAKVRGRLNSLLVTVVTDFIPHTFWINPGTDHYWVMSDEGMRKLEARGVPREKITAGGIPISLCFHPQGKRLEIRRREGLEEKRFTLLITSGSFGLGPTIEVLDGMREFTDSIQAMVVCGRNQPLYERIEARCYPFRLRLYGFVSNMDDLMEASDLIIAKPGGATTTESLAKGLPMVVLQPIPGQESGNAQLLKERNASFFLGNASDIRTILKAVLDYPGVLEEKRRSMAGLAKPDAALELARLVLARTDGPS